MTPATLQRPGAVADTYTEVPAMTQPTAAARFWSKVDRDGPIPERAGHLGPCWLWTGFIHPSGYGTFSVGKKNHRVHRYSYEQMVGPIPDGYHVDHLCFVPACVNPAHLEAVTPYENVRRSSAWDHFRGKTHCPQGHAYTPENTQITPNGQGRVGRKCLACHRERMRRLKQERRRATTDTEGDK